LEVLAGTLEARISPQLEVHMKSIKLWVALSLGAACCMAVASALGAFSDAAYSRETESWAAQGIGQDLVNLLVAVPVLLISGIATWRGSRIARPVWLGTLLYTAYSYVLYAFFVHFGPLFLLYVATLGLSVFALIGGGSAVGAERRPEPDAGRWRGWIAAYLLFVGGGFSLLWLSDVVPALLAGSEPESVAEVGFPVNPIHVLDLGLVLPATIAAGIRVLRRRPHAFAHAQVMAVFSALMGIAIIGMMLVMRGRGLSAEPVVMIGIGVVVALSVAAAIVMVAKLSRPGRLAVVAGVAAVVTAGCATLSPIPIPVFGRRGDVDALAGEWRGEYSSVESGRSGTITFSLKVAADTAHGEVIMMPTWMNNSLTSNEARTGEPRRVPQLLTVNFVRIDGGGIRGPLDTYTDPDCMCPMRTVFTGRLVNAKTLEGTYESVTTDPRTPIHGRWTATRP
jgi:hypothetical protein